MKFNLVKDGKVSLGEEPKCSKVPAESHKDRTYRAAYLDTAVVPLTQDSVETEKCTQLTALLQNYYKSNGKIASDENPGRINLRVGVSQNQNDAKTNFKGHLELVSLISGNFLEALRDYSDHEALVKVTLIFFERNSAGVRIPLCDMASGDMIIWKRCGCKDATMEFPVKYFSKWKSQSSFHANVTVEVTMPDNVLSGEHKRNKYQRQNYTFLKTANKKEGSFELQILCKDGARVPVFTSFLTCQSRVVHEMLKETIKKKREGVIEMPELSESGANALLKFLYHGDVQSAEKDCVVALELFRAAHRYEFVRLETVIRRLLLDKTRDWFTADVGVELFLFCRTLVPQDEALKLKATNVMKLYSKELTSCTAYQNIFSNDPLAAMDLSLFTLLTWEYGEKSTALALQ